MVIVGQRWLWDKFDGSKFIVEIIDINPTQVIVKQVFRGEYFVGEVHEWDPEDDNEYDEYPHWSLLEQQHLPKLK